MTTSTINPGTVLPDPPHLGHLLPLQTEISTYRQGSTNDILVNEAPLSWVHRSNPKVIADPFVWSQPLYLCASDPLTLDIQETAEQFRWRLRDSALGAAERSGVNLSATKKMCAEFGAPAPLLVPGGVVSSATDWLTLPVGSVLYRGHPDIPQRMDVWEIGENYGTPFLKHVMGSNQQGISGGTPLIIHSIPEWTRPESFGDPVSPTNWASIALRAWRVGKVYKSDQGWCGVFENMLTTLGITEDSVKNADGSAHGPGDVVTPAQAAQMAEGSLLWHAWPNTDGFALYIRDDSKRNRGKTRRVCGYRDGDSENTWDRMTVVQTPTEEMIWVLPGHHLRYLPPGSEYTRNGFFATKVVGNTDDDNLIIDHRYYAVRSVAL